jgi:phage baseplate assembly protein W
MKLSNYKLQIENAIWIDVNTRFTQDSLPDRVADDVAIIHSSLFNLFNCIPGQRARIFQPEYGSMWLHFIHEPIADITAAKMQMLMFDSIRKWEPRVNIDLDQSAILANTDIPGYEVRLVFRMPNLASVQQIQFQVSA